VEEYAESILSSLVYFPFILNDKEKKWIKLLLRCGLMLCDMIYDMIYLTAIG
jgi:hypothetical protein